MSRPLAPFGRRLLRVVGLDALGAYALLRLAEGGREGESPGGGRDSESPRGGPASGRAGGRAPDPGQFAMLAAADAWGGGEDERPFLPRAFSFARVRLGEMHFLIDPVGPGTRRLCELRSGEGVWMLGPLGVGFTAPPAGGRAILVGGGAGIAPLAILRDTLGPSAVALLGFRDRAHALGAALLDDALVATDDGSVGHRGPVTDLLRSELDRAGGNRAELDQAELDRAGGDRADDAPATVYACGPAPMLEAVRALCFEHSVPVQLALEAPMACGFGACFGCVVPRRDGSFARVCVDGPVFDAFEFDRILSHSGAPS